MSTPAHADHGDGAAWLTSSHGVAALALVAAAYAYAAALARQPPRRAGGATPRRTIGRVPVARVAAWYAGLGVIAVALFSPLDAYGAARAASAHMLQHELLLTVGPVLLVAGLDRRIVASAPRTGRRVVGVLGRPVVATPLWVAVELGWHLPAVYDAALDGHVLHLALHASLVVAGLAFWVAVLAPCGAAAPRIAGLGVAMAASGILGAVLIWSTTAVYPRYAAAAPWFGLSPLADQRLAGALMMAIDMPVLLGALGVVVAGWARWQVRAAAAAPEPAR